MEKNKNIIIILFGIIFLAITISGVFLQVKSLKTV